MVKYENFTNEVRFTGAVNISQCVEKGQIPGISRLVIYICGLPGYKYYF